MIPASWIRESTRPHSDFGAGRGYGYMWWTYAAGSLGEDYPELDRHDLYMGRGTGGQRLWVLPDARVRVYLIPGASLRARAGGGRCPHDSSR